MLGTLLRVVLIIVIVAAVAAFFVGYQFRGASDVSEPEAVGTTGIDLDAPERPARDVDDPDVSVDRARDAGARIGETVAVGANRAQQFAADGALTAKIKSKMALDDTVEAFDINVDTDGGTVTLRGTVESTVQQQRAVELARETEGVTSVVDQLIVR